MPIVMDLGFVEDIGVGGIDGLQARHGGHDLPALGSQEGNLRDACLVVLMIAITGVSKLGLRVCWGCYCYGCCGLWLIVSLSRISGPSCAFIAQARSKVTVSY